VRAGQDQWSTGQRRTESLSPRRSSRCTVARDCQYPHLGCDAASTLRLRAPAGQDGRPR